MKPLIPILGLFLVAGMAGSAPGATATLSPQDHGFVNDAAQALAAEMMQAQLVLERGQRSDVKGLARRIIADDGKADQSLHAIATGAGATLPTPVKDAKVRLTAKPRVKFDLAYIGAERQSLREETDIYRREKDRGSDPALKEFAARMLPIVQQQYLIAKELPGAKLKMPGK